MVYDVAILGAGPAGSALACALAARWRVALIDKKPQPHAQIGDALVPAAGRVLRDLGVWSAFQALAPVRYLANRSFWGSAVEEYRDFIADPDGCGWHLDRPVFETMLRDQAKVRGAHCLFSNRWQGIAPGWRLRCDGVGEISARFVVDASGRSAVLARRLGARRQAHDRMVARWCRLTGGRARCGISTVVATREGWWYHIAARREALIESTLAFHSLPETAPRGDANALLAAAKRHQGLHAQLRGTRPATAAKTIAAHSSCLDSVSGSHWLAIGDAAVCFDPIASRGLFHALYSAYVTAALLEERLAGCEGAFFLYDEEISRIYTTYLAHRRAVYQAEQRWPTALFWQ